MIKEFLNNKLLRKYLQKITLKKRLPREFKKLPLFVTPDARVKFLKPGNRIFKIDYGELLNIAREEIHLGDVVWDIGSNVGIFTFAAASIVGAEGKVLSVEPDIMLVNLLRKSLQLDKNNDLSIDILSAAIAEKVGISKFFISGRGRTGNTLQKSVRMHSDKSFRTIQLVPTVTLDLLLSVIEPPNFLKIDVEGAEDLVLLGGKQMLHEIRPIIYIEVGVDKQKKVSQILKKAKYELYGPGTITDYRRIDECEFNTIAMPNN